MLAANGLGAAVVTVETRDLAGGQFVEYLAQRVEIELIDKARAERFQQYRKIRVLL